MLTANSKSSQQIQIAHSKLQIAHSKLKSLTANYKSLTANSNRPQQIQIAHSKFKSLPFCRGSRVCFRVSRGHCRGSLFYTEKWARLQNTHTTYIELQNVATAVPQSGYNLFTIRNSHSVFIYFVTESQYLKQMTRPPQKAGTAIPQSVYNLLTVSPNTYVFQLCVSVLHIFCRAITLFDSDVSIKSDEYKN